MEEWSLVEGREGKREQVKEGTRESGREEGEEVIEHHRREN